MLKVTEFYKDNPPQNYSVSSISTSEEVPLLCFQQDFLWASFLKGKTKHVTSCTCLEMVPSIYIFPWIPCYHVLLILSSIDPSYLFAPRQHNHSPVSWFSPWMCVWNPVKSSAVSFRPPITLHQPTRLILFLYLLLLLSGFIFAENREARWSSRNTRELNW